MIINNNVISNFIFKVIDKLKNINNILMYVLFFVKGMSTNGYIVIINTNK